MAVRYLAYDGVAAKAILAAAPSNTRILITPAHCFRLNRRGFVHRPTRIRAAVESALDRPRDL